MQIGSCSYTRYRRWKDVRGSLHPSNASYRPPGAAEGVYGGGSLGDGLTPIAGQSRTFLNGFWGFFCMGQLSREQQARVESLLPDAERIACSFCGGRSPDIISTAYLAACTAVLSHDPTKGASINTWLYRAVVQALQNSWRAEWKHQHQQIDSHNEPAVWDEDRVGIEDMIATLPKKHRELFRQVVLMGTPYKLLSERAGVSKQRLHQIVCRCKQRLRVRFSWMRDDYSRLAKKSTGRRTSSPARKNAMAHAS